MKAGLLCVAFLNGKTFSQKEGYYAVMGGRGTWGPSIIAGYFVCNELVPDGVFVLKMPRSQEGFHGNVKPLGRVTESKR